MPKSDCEPGPSHINPVQAHADYDDSTGRHPTKDRTHTRDQGLVCAESKVRSRAFQHRTEETRAYDVKYRFVIDMATL